jgi:choline dehydrogenase-like flavoprotein
MRPSDETLRALVERIIPADDFPSGWQIGAGEFIDRILATDLASSAPLVEAGLGLLEQEARARHGGAGYADLPATAQDVLLEDLLAGKTAVEWGDIAPQEFGDLIVRLSTQGFYGDPDNGGNRDAVSWGMVGYRVLAPGLRWPQVDLSPPSLTSWDSIAGSYDAIVVGAGAGGGIAACVLAEAGFRVLLVERGSWLATHDLRQDHLRNHRVMLGYNYPAGPPTKANPRVFAASGGDIVVSPPDRRWNNNAMTAGGGTRVYGAQAWPFCSEDFRMATTYGVPEGSSLADWPISYEDLEPDYDRAEWELGVSGDPAGNRYAGTRRRGYPMPPLPANATQAMLSRGAAALGLSTSPVPLLINSVPYNGRGVCLNCGACVGFGCPGEFKTDTRNTVIPRAVATGRCDVLVNAQAEGIVTRDDGTVAGVALVTCAGETIRRREVYADQVLLGAGAIETARLLLNSKSAREPNGIGNNHDQVGRNLQGHVYAGVVAIFDEIVQDCAGPGPRIATNDYRHHNEGIVGGAMIANDFVPTPLFVWSLLSSLGAIPSWGASSKQGMRDIYPRMALVMGPVQEVPNPESRVTIDSSVRDGFGIPVARLSGSLHREDSRTAAFISEKAVAWAKASGAKMTLPLLLATAEGPSGGQHQAGTCRMGSDPATSVTDAWGAVWGHDNLHIVDGSLHVTNGGVNPVLTIMALSYRVSRHVAGVTSNE